MKKENTRQLKVLSNLIEELDSTIDLKERLHIATNKILQTMDSEMSSIMLKDKQEQHLVIEYAQGLNSEVIRDTRVEIGKGISGWVAQQGQPLLIQDLSQDRRFPVRKRSKYYNNSLLSVPLRVKDDVLGVINVNNKKSKGIFTQGDLKFLTQIANHVALAIKNARQLKELKSKSEMEVDMLSSLSHEMRNCLTNIREGVSLISEGIIGKINQKQAKVLKLAQSNIDRLVRLSNEFLDFSKIESGRMQLNRTLVDLTALAQRTLDLFKFTAERNRIQLELIPAKTLDKIWADQDRLSQVFTNLLNNALKFTQAEGKISVQLKDEGQHIKVIVSDTGKGIYESDQKKIFGRFEQADPGSKEIKQKGSGLGLAIVKEIIQMHKGKIWVESQPGEGTKFIFTLPKDVRALPRQTEN